MKESRESKKRPLVGIAFFTYNYGKYIDEALESLRRQTFQDFEIYLSDDASNDGFTQDKIKSLEYEKITKKLLYQKNAGVAKRARELYKIIDNKYLVVLCADDMFAPDFLEKTVAFLEKHPDYGAVSTNILEYKDNFSGEPFYEFKYDATKMCFPEMLVRCYCLGSSLMRNKALKDVDLNGGFTRYQDWDRYVSMLESGWKLGVVEEPLFLYRQHGDSLSHSASKEMEMEMFEKMLKKHAKSYDKYHEEVMKQIYYSLLEVREGKDWLERQYENYMQEVDKLHGIIAELKQESAVVGFYHKLKNRIRKK